jgi:anti-sigma factor RsiW
MAEDEELVALADNELDEEARKTLLARLAQDEALRARFNALRKSRAEILADCDSLLAQAPVTRLCAALPPLEEDPFRGFAQRFCGSAIGARRHRISLVFPSAR